MRIIDHMNEVLGGDLKAEVKAGGRAIIESLEPQIVVEALEARSDSSAGSHTMGKRLRPVPKPARQEPVTRQLTGQSTGGVTRAEHL